jgi:integrase/recombinase XerD
MQGFFADKLIREHNASTHTVASYRDTFVLLLRFASDKAGREPHMLTMADLDTETIAAFLTHLESVRGNSVTTRNTRLAGIRSFFRYASYRCPEHADTIARVLTVPIKRTDRAVVAYLTATEAEALIIATDVQTWTGRRDHALLHVAVHTGLRVSELTAVTVADTHLGPGAHLRCHGKGRKDRDTPLTKPTVAILNNWIPELENERSGPLFPTRRGTALSRDAVAKLLKKYTAEATKSCPSLAGKNVTPHTLRHTTAMLLLHAGVDLTVIAMWLGHESTETTQIYLHADMSLKEKALERLTPSQDTGTGRYHAPDELLDFLAKL